MKSAKDTDNRLLTTEMVMPPFSGVNETKEDDQSPNYTGKLYLEVLDLKKATENAFTAN